MIKVTCVRTGRKKFNRKLKGQFVRTFDNLFDLSNWINKAFPNACLVKAEEELTKEQIKWLYNRRQNYLNSDKFNS